MPMLMTLRMRLPVWPFHSPLRTRLEKSAILSSTAWTSGTTFSPSTTMDAPLRRAQGHVQDGPVLRDVDLLAAEHGVDPRSQAGFLGQLQEKLERFVGDAILRVVEVEPDRLDRHALAALGIIREELAQMQLPDLLIVSFEGLPRRTFGERLIVGFTCQLLSFRSGRPLLARSSASSITSTFMTKLPVTTWPSPGRRSSTRSPPSARSRT